MLYWVILWSSPYQRANLPQFSKYTVIPFSPKIIVFKYILKHKELLIRVGLGVGLSSLE